jgi:glycosyltransferase involved in cell wall biosynthesis
VITAAIVVPCFNEESVLRASAERLLELLTDLHNQEVASLESQILFVDDGSSDQTWSLIETLAQDDRRVCGIRLSRNHGHQRALLAGLLSVRSEVVISIDADLQDDIAVIPEMLAAYRSGHDVVYGVRVDRSSDSFFKRTTARLFYRTLKIMGVEVISDHADFRLLSRRALDALREYSEVNLFLRGVIPTIGFPSTTVEYSRSRRESGESKYPLRRMLSLAIDGITSFSVVPLRIIAVAGVIVSLITVVLSIWVVWTKLTNESAVPGWASSVLPVYLLGGIQLLGIGVVGEYIGKIYIETKRRPRFIIQSMIGERSIFMERHSDHQNDADRT